MLTYFVVGYNWLFGGVHTICQFSIISMFFKTPSLSHWGWVTQICVSKLKNIIGSDNGLSPCQHLSIIWTNAGIFSIGPLGTHFSEIVIEIYIFSFKKIAFRLSSGNWWSFCLSLDVLNTFFKPPSDYVELLIAASMPSMTDKALQPSLKKTFEVKSKIVLA